MWGAESQGARNVSPSAARAASRTFSPFGPIPWSFAISALGRAATSDKLPNVCSARWAGRAKPAGIQG